MQTFAAGTTVRVTIPLVDLNGDPVTPTAIEAAVNDQDGTPIVPPYVVAFTPGDTDVEITVPADKNQITGPAGARTVFLEVTTADGVFELFETYLLRGAVRLTVPTNSFQTYEQALVEASLMPPLTGWNAASAIDRKNALEEAYRRLSRIGYRVWRPEDVDAQNYYVPDELDRIEPRLWPIMSLDRFLKAPAHFRKALCRAQLQEANEILSGDVVSQKRRQGLLSESIGESSMMFRSGRPIDLGITTETRAHLTGFIDLRYTVTRS
jgi:hypothetical protein